ncbi:MAG: HNH endonuclease signature motif containing protein [Chloroflexi bacterium]|nr:HNH endonuclease signature motif containing protein [Chloroflexota bacterium]MCY3581213.1 HNH endonuclease signature motif containing protein [Chloroflexota bacterium]MCY3716517.1 HNH endonuclease signature motif containing protein [Chloroflexota bacterium]MDE2649809.1 HNH endonuclease signature motif containing protein [Chloroflexota bacterium]MXX51009.1 HNH endonuclease [Chloroflexota bacterium]
MIEAPARYVFERAGRCCEYCRIGDGREPVSFQIDHIIAIKHGGDDNSDNLRLSCAECNLSKGAEVAAIDPLTGEATRLYHPRYQTWDAHFRIDSDAKLTGTTPEGRTTILVLRMNDSARIEQRNIERLLGSYPCQNNPSP